MLRLGFGKITPDCVGVRRRLFGVAGWVWNPSSFVWCCGLDLEKSRLIVLVSVVVCLVLRLGFGKITPDCVGVRRRLFGVALS